LVQVDGKLGLRPALARFWQASQDGRVWTFQLRPGVRFHHGRELTADDVVYSFTRLLEPQNRSPSFRLFMRVQGADAFRAGTADHVAGFEVLDPYTLRITLSEPYALFIHHLVMTAAKIVPRDEVEQLGEVFGQHPVGTGPFRLVRWEPDASIVLEAYPDHFRRRPYLDQLHFRIFPRSKLKAALAAFEQGELEETQLPVQVRQRLLNEPHYRVVRQPLLATLFLLLDTQPGPLHHPQVRQAINYAINREAINGTLRQGYSRTASGILPFGMPGYNFDLHGYPYDPEHARRLLAEAGYPNGQGLGPLELWTSVESDIAKAEHTAVKRALEQLGLTVQLRTASSWTQYKREIIGKRPGGIYRYAWYADFADPYNFLYTLFHSTSPGNYTNYANPQVDRLLDQAQRELDQRKRLALYRQAESLIMEDAPTVNLVYYAMERLFQPYVRGIEVQALGEHFTPMHPVWLDR
jgi:peptide/nickel transport system substrate-binding protein/oligopeptide transport system substrate-binding protein